MINIQGTRDFSEYKNDFFKGLDFRETVFGAATVIVAGGSYFLLFQAGFPSLIAVYTAIILGLPIGVMGFFKKNDMNFMQFMKRRKELAASKPLVYETGEASYLGVEELPLEEPKQNIKKRGRNKNGY